MRFDPSQSPDVVTADRNAPKHSLEQFQKEFLKNLDNAAVSWFSGIPDSLFTPRVEQVAHESWESVARKWEADGWGTDPRFSDRQFAKLLLRVLGDLYPGDSVQTIVEEATDYVKQARTNQSGRILSWDEVQQLAAKEPDRWRSKYLALRFVTLMQTADGFSWELIYGPAPQKPADQNSLGPHPRKSLV